jgi:cytochrome b6-f complex iron-sulfur subunit
MNRRESVRKLLLGGSVVIAVPTVLARCSTGSSMTDTTQGGANLTVDLSLSVNSALNSNGGSKVVQGVIIINMGTGFVALSSICTHQGCTVNYDASSGRLVCPCHGSIFSIEGSVVNGPALSPLQVYKVSEQGNVLTISP